MLGSQVPTKKCVPEYEYSRGDDAIAIAEIAGLELDPWQRDLLVDGMGVIRRPSQLMADQGDIVERWAAFEVGVELSRQNGKSVVFEARVLAGLYVLREQLIVYSAHKAETALGAYNRIEQLIRSDPELLAEVKGVNGDRGFRRTNGKEAIELATGQVIKFRTRTAGGGRGLSGDCVILDESQDLNEDHLAALFPVLSARKNPQIWYGGSAGGQHSVVQARLVRRAEADAPRLVYYRFALPEDADRGDPASWARVNPALGRRMTVEFFSSEFDAMSLEKFSRERLGQGDYPRPEGEDWVIPRSNWEAGEDPESAIVGPCVFSVEVRWNRGGASISVAGLRADGEVHVETLASRRGTKWVPQELARLMEVHENRGVMLDETSPAGTLLGPLYDLDIEPHLLKPKDLTQAFGDFYDGFMVDEPTYHHTGGTIMTAALAEAQVRNLLGSTTWRRATDADVTSLLSATWAAHGLKILETPEPPPRPRRAGAGDPRVTRRGGTDLATVSF